MQKRFNFPENTVELYAEKVANRGLCAIAQAESLRYKLLGGLAVRRACYGVLRFIMESGAKGCEVSGYSWSVDRDAVLVLVGSGFWLWYRSRGFLLGFGCGEQVWVVGFRTWLREFV